jgi:hypothetical protein
MGTFKLANLRYAVPAALAILLGCAGVSTPVHAATPETIVVLNDQGGLLRPRREKIKEMKISGQAVRIKGNCNSACTMYLPLPNTCVYPKARIGFHGPFTLWGKKMTPKAFDYWSAVMAEDFRKPLHDWFMNESRYKKNGFRVLSGATLIGMGYTECDPADSVTAPRFGGEQR